MDKLRIKNFRCFKDTGELSFAPITFLVGENSSGKTSFLAGYQYIHNFLRFGRALSFNTRPFNLGSPEQILRRGAEEISFQTRWKMKEGHPFLRTEKRNEDFEKDRASQKKPSVGIDVSLSTVGGELSVITLEAAMLSGVLKAKRYGAGKDKKIRLSFSSQNKSETGFSGIPIDEMSTEEMEYHLWKSFRFDSMRQAHSDKGRNLAQEKRDREKIADRLRHELRRIMMSSGLRRTGLASIRMSRTLENLFAFAPMRTEPLRVYEQKDIVSRSPTGEHIPRLLYDLFVRTSQTPHAKFFKRELAKWGDKSGLFSGLKIRQLGEHSFDPYQVLVVPKKNAPPDNLVDVGYGVSQVLPIVSDILDKARHGSVTFLIQQPEVHLHPRAQAELTTFFFRMHRETGARFLIETHSDYLLDRAAIEIQEARNKKSESGRGAKPQDIFAMLYFEQNQARTESKIHQLTFDENGDVLGIPKNYRNFFLVERKRHLGI